MKRQFGVAQRAYVEAAAAFERLDAAVPANEKAKWETTERQAMQERKADIKVMDMFEIQMDRGEFNLYRFVLGSLMYRQ